MEEKWNSVQVQWCLINEESMKGAHSLLSSEPWKSNQFQRQHWISGQVAGQQNVTYPLSFHEVQLRKTVDPEWNLKYEVEFKDEAGRKKKSLWKTFNQWK